MSTSQFYYFFNKIKNPKLSYPALIQHLDSMKFEIQSDPFIPGSLQPPDLFILISPRMKEMFQKYGHVSSFDMTFNIVKEHEDGRTWKTGILAGQSSCKRIIPFALVFST